MKHRWVVYELSSLRRRPRRISDARPTVHMPATAVVVGSGTAVLKIEAVRFV
jgi:hypothetical protein